jgi:hypothetical protein
MSNQAKAVSGSVMKNQLYQSRSMRLASNKRWSFLAGAAITLAAASLVWAAPPWSPPVVLSKAAVNAESPAVAVNDSGKMAAVWARQVGFGFTVEASVNLSGTWSRAVALSPRGQSGIEPDVAIDGNGIATAVWSSGTTIMSSTFSNGAWSAPLALSAVGASATIPQVVVDPAGNVTAMWLRYSTAGVPVFETAARPANGSWTAVVSLAGMTPQDFQLVTNAAGNMAVIWDVGSFVSSDTVYVSDRQFGGTWSAPYILAPAGYRQGGARIGIDAAGNLTACWRTNIVINTADKSVGGNWGTTQALYTNLAVSDYPTLAKTPSGDDMAAFITYVSSGGGYNYQIQTAVRPAGGPWGASAFLTSNKEYDLELHAGTTPGGSFVLSWVDANTLKFKSSTRTATTAWTPISVITTGEFGTNLAVGGNTALAIWLGGSYQAMVSTSPVSP